MFWRPSYIRRMPRFYDGAGRLMDLGDTLDLRLAPESDVERLAEDWAVVRDDLRRGIQDLRSHVRSIAD
jgi:hypothetical protein